MMASQTRVGTRIWTLQTQTCLRPWSPRRNGLPDPALPRRLLYGGSLLLRFRRLRRCLKHPRLVGETLQSVRTVPRYNRRRTGMVVGTVAAAAAATATGTAAVAISLRLLPAGEATVGLASSIMLSLPRRGTIRSLRPHRRRRMVPASRSGCGEVSWTMQSHSHPLLMQTGTRVLAPRV